MNQSRFPATDKVFNPSRSQVVYRPNGQLRSLSAGGMLVRRAPDGRRIVSVERQDHSSVVVLPGGSGWVQHPFTHGNLSYVRRTYVMGGVTYSRFYREVQYRGLALHLYAPLRYLRPTFYVWAARPWGRTVAYEWDWRNKPWFVSYGRAFTPYGYYPAASMWMTDFVLSNAMEAAYQQEPGSRLVSPLSPYAKAQINDEIGRQTLLMGKQADWDSRGLPPGVDSGSVTDVLADNQAHTFVAGSELLVVNGGGEECALSPGDAVQVVSAPRNPDDTTVDATVLWGKGSQDCRTGSTVTIAVQDLQEMQNSMRVAIDLGLDKLKAQQGKGIVPPGPADANGPSSAQAFLLDAPPADATAQVEITAESRQADAAEQNASHP